MDKLEDVPASREEALKTGRTYYRSEDRCPKCRTCYRWAHNDKCMACNPEYAEAV